MLTHPSLLLRIRDASDADAWTEFVNVYGPIVYAYSRRRGLNDSDAADVTQEVMAQVAQSIGSFDYQPEKGRFRSWLGRVTKSKINRLRRRAEHSAGGERAMQSELLENEVAEETDSEWIEHFSAEIMNVALERIRPNFELATWQAFEAVWVHNRPAAEVAQEMGRPVVSVYLAKSRALARLRAEILSLAEDIPALVPLH